MTGSQTTSRSNSSSTSPQTNGSHRGNPYDGKVYSDYESHRQAFERATSEATHTKVSNAALEARMDDVFATFGERVEACIWRYSWGNQCLYFCDLDGSPRFQSDIAKRLKADKRRVSATIAWLVERDRIKMVGTAKMLYPAISPVPAKPSEIVKKSGEWRTFLQLMEVAHSPDLAALEVARSEVKRLQKVLLSGYKEFRKSGTIPAPSLIKESKEDLKEIPPPSQPVSLEPESMPEPKEPAGRLEVGVSENGSSKPTPPHGEVRGEVSPHGEVRGEETLKPGDTVTIPVVNAVNPPGPADIRKEVSAYLENIVRPGLTPEIVDEVASYITTPELFEAFKWESQPAMVQHARSWKYWVRIAERVAADGPRLAAAKANEGNGHSPPERMSSGDIQKADFVRRFREQEQKKRAPE